MDKYERDLMSIFNCEPFWPVCLFDFTFKAKNPTYLCLRVSNTLDSYIREGYFYGVNSQLQQAEDLYQPGLIIDVDSNTTDEMLIERNQHLCQCKEFPYFVHNFK